MGELWFSLFFYMEELRSLVAVLIHPNGGMAEESPSDKVLAMLRGAHMGGVMTPTGNTEPFSVQNAQDIFEAYLDAYQEKGYKAIYVGAPLHG